MKITPGALVRVKVTNKGPKDLVMWLRGAAPRYTNDVQTYVMKENDTAVVILCQEVYKSIECLILCNGCMGWVYASQLTELK